MASLSATTINIEPVESAGGGSGNPASISASASTSSTTSGAMLASSSGTSSMVVAASPILFVQDLVNEMTHSVMQTAASASDSADQSGSAPVQLIKRPFESSHSGKDGSRSSTGYPLSTANTKRARSSKSSNEENNIRQKLEQRLGGILCCAVCLDLPKSSVYQCTNGHLMCAGCFTHLLADALIRNETATCPNCRCIISKEDCSRNLAVEKAVCELPGECRYCNRELPRSLLEKHMTDICDDRIVACRFASIGCPWNGPFHEVDFHVQICQHPNKSCREVLDHLGAKERVAKEEKKIYDSLFNLLSFEKITFSDIQFRPYRTDEYIHKLFYETSRFSAFNLQWVVKARVNDDQRDPTQSCERELNFQLVLKSKLPSPMTIHYMILKGPFGDMKTSLKLYKHDFSESSTESSYNRINLIDSAECNRLLAAKVINFRLIMFQAPK